MPGDVVVIIGSGPVARGVERELQEVGVPHRRLRRPADRELSRALPPEVGGVVVVLGDVEALRTALLVEHVRPGIRLVVTVFDRTVAEQMRRAIPNCRVHSAADAARGAIVAACLGDALLLTRAPDGPIEVRRAPEDPHASGAVASPDAGDPGAPSALVVPTAPAVRRTAPPGPPRWRRIAWALVAQLRPPDRTARLLLASLVALLALVVAETVLVAVSHHEPVGVAIYSAVKATTTVGPSTAVEHDPGWLQAWATLSFALALGAGAVFTAALTGRLMRSRPTAIVGRRVVPRGEHVVVVGLGRVGLRVAGELRALGVPVVVVERDPEARHLRVARRRSIPVVIGDGGSRVVLERLALGRARALAAVCGDELANIAVGVAALAVAPDLRVVLRAGGGDVTRETQALFPIGVVQDVDRLAAAVLARGVRGRPVDQAFHDGDAVGLLLDDGTVLG